MNFLEKLRSKPRETKVIILWSIIVPVGIIFFFIWLRILNSSIENFSRISFPEIDRDALYSEEMTETINRIETLLNEEEIKKILEDEDFKRIMEILESEDEEEVKRVLEEMNSLKKEQQKKDMNTIEEEELEKEIEQ